VRDLTERKQTQSAIKMAELVFNNIKDSLCVINADRIIQSANPAFYQLCGCKPELLSYQCPLDKFIADSKYIKNFADALMQVKPGNQKQIELLITSKNNIECPVMAIISGVDSSETMERSKYVVIFHDITEQLKLRARQEALQKQATNIQKMTLLSTISAGIIHEINQPLNSIKILADSLIYLNKKGRPVEKEKIFDNLQKISEQIVRIDEIIKQMRSFAGYKQGCATTKCDLNAAIEKTGSLLKHQLKLKEIKFTKKLAADLEEIQGNVNIIEEVVINLVINAIQAFSKITGREKEIICETRRENDKIIFEVKDNAIGITDELKEKIFDPFFSTKTLDGGMGLGLAIVSSILNGYNSRIEVYNNKLGGATFKVEIPIAKPGIE